MYKIINYFHHAVRLSILKSYRFTACFCLFTFSILFSGLNIYCQENKFPVFNDQRISSPEGLPLFYAKDFQVDPERLDQYPDGFIYADQSTLELLADYFQSDPEGRKIWEVEAEFAAEILNQWDFKRSGFGNDHYIYNLGQLQRLSIIYLFSGQNALGRFIMGHTLQIAELPFEFWVHAVLRGYDPARPKGGLETAELSASIAVTISAAKDMFSLTDRELIENALNTKGLQPLLTWLDKPYANNWTAVVSTGAYITSTYLDYTEGKEKSMNALKAYVQGSIETDGSYGEGLGYFNYPIKTLFNAVLVMSPGDREKVFSTSGLRYSALWIVYHYFHNIDSQGRYIGDVVHFGDNGYLGPDGKTVNLILAALFKDPLATWLLGEIDGRLGIKELFLVRSITGGLPEPKSPEQLELTRLKVFNSGICIMRSGWEKNSIVLALWSGDGSRVRFSHQRPELNSICMGAYGEYMIVSPAAASYRSDLRFQWDLTTRSANTITIDEKNQMFPGDGKYSWNKTDISDFWMQGTPSAMVIQVKKGEIADLLVNEAAKAYHVPMEHARRLILFVPDPGYYVVVDRMEAIEGSHKYTWRIHLNNRDSLGLIEEIDRDHHWYFSRPLANLDIYLFSDREIRTNIGKGYMHRPSRDYSPCGKNEGKLGSSIELEAFNLENTRVMTYYSVIYPSRKGETSPNVRFTGNEIIIGKDVISFSRGTCRLRQNGKTEEIELR